jgi:hypothetical protein
MLFAIGISSPSGPRFGEPLDLPRLQERRWHAALQGRWTRIPVIPMRQDQIPAKQKPTGPGRWRWVRESLLEQYFYSTISFSPERHAPQQQQAETRQVWRKTIMMDLFIARSPPRSQHRERAKWRWPTVSRSRDVHDFVIHYDFALCYDPTSVLCR